MSNQQLTKNEFFSIKIEIIIKKFLSDDERKSSISEILRGEK